MKLTPKLIPLLFLCFISHFSFGNEGSYYKRGGVIYPIKKTKISIEFLNPENIERNLQVGFQTPNAIGDVDCLTRSRN